MKIYLVKVYKDCRNGETECTDDQYYVAGIYTDKKKAEKRKEKLNEIFGTENVWVKPFDTDVDFPIHKEAPNAYKNDPDYEYWLGGGYYYE